MPGHYEPYAADFMRCRNPRIGPNVVADWSRTLSPGATILELGCGHGVVSQALIDGGFQLYAVDEAPTLLEAFRKQFPGVPVECAAVEDSTFFSRQFDAAVAWGLMFLLPSESQELVIAKVARALHPGGRFLFTSPPQRQQWTDAISYDPSLSLGREEYVRLLQNAGMTVSGHATDEGENFYYFCEKR